MQPRHWTTCFRVASGGADHLALVVAALSHTVLGQRDGDHHVHSLEESFFAKFSSHHLSKENGGLGVVHIFQAEHWTFSM